MKVLSFLEIRHITHAVISKNEVMLAVGIENNSTKSISIKLYDIKSCKEEIRELQTFLIPQGENIEYIDFSKNNKALLAGLSSGRNYAIDLFKEGKENIKDDLIAFIEWHDEAQKLYDRNQKIISKIESKYGLNDSNNKYHTKNNDGEDYDGSWIVKINEITDNIFVIIDTEANVFIFNNEPSLLSRSRLRISDPSIIRFSPSRKLIGIASEIDRNIVVFDIGLSFIES